MTDTSDAAALSLDAATDTAAANAFAAFEAGLFPDGELPEQRKPRPSPIEALLMARARARDSAETAELYNICFPNAGTSGTSNTNKAVTSQAEALSHLFARYHGNLPETMWLMYLPRLLERGDKHERLCGAIPPAKRSLLGGSPLLGVMLPPSAVGRYMFNAMSYTLGLEAAEELRRVPGLADVTFRPIVSSVFGKSDVVDRIVDVMTLALHPCDRAAPEGMVGLTVRPDSVVQTPMQALAHTAVFVADYIGDHNRAPVNPHMERAWRMAYGRARSALPLLVQHVPVPDRSIDGLRGRLADAYPAETPET